jgi:hypothetical protein
MESKGLCVAWRYPLIVGLNGRRSPDGSRGGQATCVFALRAAGEQIDDLIFRGYPHWPSQHCIQCATVIFRTVAAVTPICVDTYLPVRIGIRSAKNDVFAFKRANN